MILALGILGAMSFTFGCGYVLGCARTADKVNRQWIEGAGNRVWRFKRLNDAIETTGQRWPKVIHG